MCEIAINIPEAVLYDTKMNVEDAKNFVRRVIALEYYKNQGVSIGYCAEIAGMTETEFIQFLGKNKISVFQFDDDDEFMNEAKNA